MNTKLRIEKFLEKLEQSGAHGYIITNLLNIRYLTNFTGSAALLVVRITSNETAARALLCTDGRYREQAQHEIASCGDSVELFVGSTQQQLEKAAKFLNNVSETVLDPDSTTVSELERWKHLLGNPPLFAKFKVESLRRFKDQDEVELITKASSIADSALDKVLPRLLEGPTELEFASELDYQMRKDGAQGPSFETIVASGPNSAMPHARPTGRKIAEGDTVVIDFGATFDGYHSDCTRTYILSEKSNGEFDAVYGAVKDSQLQGCNLSTLGSELGNIDQSCRQTLDSYDLLEYFTHGTGHGVGLEIHELPWVSPNNPTKLDFGDVITVEPGVYLPGKFGVRIEDTLAITPDGTRVLTQIAKSPYLS